MDLNDDTAKGIVSKANNLTDHLRKVVAGYDKDISYVVCNPTEKEVSYLLKKTY